MTRSILLLALLSTSAQAGEKEAHYRDRFCAGMAVEVHMDNGTRADCVSGRLAIEVEWAAKWKEAIGQALSYAASTKHYPAVILICKPKKTETERSAEARCEKLYHRLEDAVTDPRWPIPFTVWQCRTSDARLSDCRRSDLGGGR